MEELLEWLHTFDDLQFSCNHRNVIDKIWQIKSKQKFSISVVDKRYDANKYTPPFRVGRKQGKAVLDSKGLEVVFFMYSEDQAKMYCDYLNNVC